LITGGDLLRITGVPPVGCTLVNGYRPTEATVLSTSHRVAGFTIGTAPPIGRAISGASPAWSCPRLLARTWQEASHTGRGRQVS
jgi:hypothetical protein